MFKKLTFILILFFILASCESVSRGLTGQKRNNTDEFLVEKKDPLVLPPSYKDLPSPENVDQVAENKEEIETILSIENIEKNTQKTTSANSSAEESILKKIREKK